MYVEDDRPFTRELYEVRDAKKNWGWFLALGILLVLLGSAVISSSYYATVFSIIFFGFFLVAAGIVQIVQAFLAHKWSGLFLSLLVGILYVITGALAVFRPELTAVTLTLWIALFCFAVGLFKMISSLILRFDQWGWVFFNGLITFLLGLMIYTNWPLSGLWVIGLFIGIDLLLSGISWIALSITGRRYLR